MPEYPQVETTPTRKTIQAACAGPHSDNFPTTLVSCCGAQDSAWQYFDINGTICFVRVEQQHRHSRVPGLSKVSTQSLRDTVQMQRRVQPDFRHLLRLECAPPPDDVKEGQQTCGLTASPNSTRAMMKCCSGFHGENMLLHEDECEVVCASNSVKESFEECLGNSADLLNSLMFCWTRTSTNQTGADNGTDTGSGNGTDTINGNGTNSDKDNGGQQVSPSFAGVVTMLLLMSSVFTYF